MIGRVVQVLVVLVVFGVLVRVWLEVGRRRMGRPLPEPLPLGRRTNWQEGRQILIYGRLGAGKTALAMQRAVKLARSLRVPLVSNAPVRDDAVVLRSWADLADLELCFEAGDGCRNDSPDHRCPGCAPAVILLDEVHLWLPSQPGLMPTDQVRDAIHLLSFARKRGWTVIATTQYPTRVSTQFRYLCTEMIEVRPFSQGVVHYIRQIDPDTGKQVLGFAGVFFPRRGRYNHRAEVEPLWNLGLDSTVPVRKRRQPARDASAAPPAPPSLPVPVWTGTLTTADLRSMGGKS